MVPGAAALASKGLDAVSGMGSDSSSLSYSDQTSFGGNITQTGGNAVMWVALAVGVMAAAYIWKRKG